MITEMLDFDRLEAGKIKLDLRPLDLNELVDEAVERAVVSSPRHFVKAVLQRGLPPVFGDADRLTQVLTNLLSNAIKYSPLGGEVCVSSRLTGGAVEVSVTDHGKGIPPEFIRGRSSRCTEARSPWKASSVAARSFASRCPSPPSAARLPGRPDL